MRSASAIRALIEGRAALIVVDIQASAFAGDDDDKDRAIPHQEIHRANGIDFGRELDGSETVHCLDNNKLTSIASEQLGFRTDDYLIQNRRHSRD